MGLWKAKRRPNPQKTHHIILHVGKKGLNQGSIQAICHLAAIVVKPSKKN